MLTPPFVYIVARVEIYVTYRSNNQDIYPAYSHSSNVASGMQPVKYEHPLGYQI